MTFIRKVKGGYYFYRSYRKDGKVNGEYLGKATFFRKILWRMGFI
jgi:hypothetical protein